MGAKQSWKMQTLSQILFWLLDNQHSLAIVMNVFAEIPGKRNHWEMVLISAVSPGKHILILPGLEKATYAICIWLQPLLNLKATLTIQYDWHSSTEPANAIFKYQICISFLFSLRTGSLGKEHPQSRLHLCQQHEDNIAVILTQKGHDFFI